MLRKVLYIVGGLIVTAMLVSVVGLGFLAYKLDAQVTQARADNQALQARYDGLNAEYAKARDDFKAQSAQADADLGKSNTDLTAAQAQIKTLEGDLQKVRAENTNLKANLDTIQSKVDILNTFWFMDAASFEGKVNASNDAQLQKLYRAFTAHPTTNNVLDLMSYMIKAVVDSSGLN